MAVHEACRPFRKYGLYFQGALRADGGDGTDHGWRRVGVSDAQLRLDDRESMDQ
jgi:hypothetical protein